MSHQGKVAAGVGRHDQARRLRVFVQDHQDVKLGLKDADPNVRVQGT